MLLNALVHRNYMGAPIQIRVYDDKISVWNEGKLPEGLTSEALKRTHSSQPRNPIIADVSFKGVYIDAWGRGTIKILDSCKQAELSEPDMQEQEGGFITTVYKNKLTEEFLSKLGLNQRQLKAVLVVKEFTKITNKQYQEINNCSRNTASNDLAGLTNNKKILVSSEQKGAGSFYILK